MKSFIVSCLLILVACGSGGSGTNTLGDVSNPTPTPVPPGCKALQSAWTSTTDQEAHNLSGLPFTSAAFTAYTWTGYNGSTCSQSAKLYAGNSVVTGAGFHYVIEFQNNSPGIGCEFWQDGSGPSATHGSALIKVECLQITLCRDVNANPSDCQVFN